MRIFFPTNTTKERSSGERRQGRPVTETETSDMPPPLPVENDQEEEVDESPGELGSPGKSYNSIPTQESPSKRSAMFEKRKAQDISWEDLNFVVNQEIHVLKHVWGKPPFPHPAADFSGDPPSAL